MNQIKQEKLEEDPPEKKEGKERIIELLAPLRSIVNDPINSSFDEIIQIYDAEAAKVAALHEDYAVKKNNLSSKYNKTKRDHEKIQQKYDELKKEHKELQEKYDSDMAREITDIKNQYVSYRYQLSHSYKGLQDKYDGVKSERDDLKKKYESESEQLKKSYKELEAKYDKVKSENAILKRKYEPAKKPVAKPKTSTNLRSFIKDSEDEDDDVSPTKRLKVADETSLILNKSARKSSSSTSSTSSTSPTSGLNSLQRYDAEMMAKVRKPHRYDPTDDLFDFGPTRGVPMSKPKLRRDLKKQQPEQSLFGLYRKSEAPPANNRSSKDSHKEKPAEAPKDKMPAPKDKLPVAKDLTSNNNLKDKLPVAKEKPTDAPKEEDVKDEEKENQIDVPVIKQEPREEAACAIAVQDSDCVFVETKEEIITIEDTQAENSFDMNKKYRLEDFDPHYAKYIKGYESEKDEIIPATEDQDITEPFQEYEPPFRKEYEGECAECKEKYDELAYDYVNRSEADKAFFECPGVKPCEGSKARRRALFPPAVSILRANRHIPTKQQEDDPNYEALWELDIERVPNQHLKPMKK